MATSVLSHILRASWFNSGYMYMFRLSRLWKNSLRTSWYLAPTWSAPVLPEEYRKMAGFWVMPLALASSSHFVGVCLAREIQAFLLGCGDDFSSAFSACLLRARQSTELMQCFTLILREGRPRILRSILVFELPEEYLV